MTKSPREILEHVFLEGVADGGTGGSMEDVVSKAATDLKEAVLVAVGKDEEFRNVYQWQNAQMENLVRTEIRKAILTMFEGE